MCKRITNKQRPFKTRNFYSCHPPGVKKAFIKGEALRLLRTNSSHSTFNKNMQSFKTRLKNRGYPNEFLEKKALENKDKSTKKKILPFVTQYHPALPTVKNILIGKWHLIQNQPYLKEIFHEPPILLYRKGKSLKDTLAQPRQPRTGGSVVEHRAVTREVVSSTPTGPTLRVLK